MNPPSPSLRRGRRRIDAKPNTQPQINADKVCENLRGSFSGNSSACICVHLRLVFVSRPFAVWLSLVRRPAHGVSATALQEIEVGAEVGLQDVIVIKAAVTACRRFCRLPGFASPV
jgi:hypothetical protein